LVWLVVYYFLFRWTPSFCLHTWRICLLRLFGATIGHGCKVAPSAFVWAPWNLTMGDFCCLAGHTDIYTVDSITIASNVTVSQRSFLCTASHDICSLRRPLTHKPIAIGEHAWVCAEAFVGPGVTIGEGSVVAARGVVTRDVAPWTVVGGNPAKKIKDRDVNQAP
jgi:putative colanic acid biosynthesis acetyltransferase WcaF